jgi:cyclopropane fatty-acyl-phospholipid synthase-like methyltransferase
VKPFSEACERNKQPILDVLAQEFAHVDNVLEIGSGTGQHAVFFAEALPHVLWQTSDLAENLAGIRAWIEDAALPNLRMPIALDARGEWPDIDFDAVFSANTVHIMSWDGVSAMFEQIGRRLPAHGRFALYGPFRYGGRHTSESNAAFDQWLQARDPLSGIRDVEALETLARANGLALGRDYPMPANNRTLIWHRPGRY